VTPAKLRAWRRRKFGAGTEGVKGAAKWYGCTTRAWYYWEGGQRPIPRPLKMLAKTM
jgi:hypothetical protein